MTPPDSNLDKQKKRHRGPLLGIVAALVVAGLLFLGYLTYIVDSEAPDEPSATEETLQEGVGIPAEGEPATPLNDPDGSPQLIEEEPTPGD